jgi:curved DNA-binding protein CbpA
LPVFRLTILAYRQIQPFRITQMNTSERFYKPNGCSSWLRSVPICSCVSWPREERSTKSHEITRNHANRRNKVIPARLICESTYLVKVNSQNRRHPSPRLATFPFIVHTPLRLILLSRIDGDAPRAQNS